MVALSKTYSSTEIPPVVAKPESSVLTRKSTLGIAAGVLAFWLVALSVLGGAVYWHRQTLAKSSGVLPIVSTLIDSQSDGTQPVNPFPEPLIANDEQGSPPVINEEVIAEAQPEPEPAGPNKEEVLEDFKSTIDSMGEATMLSIRKLEAKLNEIYDNQQGMSQFAAEMFDGPSRAQCLFDPPAHQKWVKRRFHDLILDPEDLTRFIDATLNDLNVELLRTRAEELVRLKLDQELEHQTTGFASTEGTDIEKLLNSTARTTSIEVAENTTEFVARWASSEIAGELASRATRALAGDSDFAQILAFVVEMETSKAVDDAMYKHADPEGKLKNVLREGIQQISDRIFDVDLDQSVVRQFIKLGHAHKQAQLDAMSKWLPAGTYLEPLK